MSSDQLSAIADSFTSTSLPDSEAELVGEIPFLAIEPFQAQALKTLAEDVELPGFRKGHVPLDMVKKRVGDIALLEEAIELFMRDFYPVLVASKDVDAIGRPEIRITKLAPGNPVGIQIKTAVYPTITLPEGWKTTSSNIAEEPAPAVEEKEIDDALLSIRRAKAKADKKGVAPIGHTHDDHEGHDHSHEHTDAEENPVTAVPPEESLPALDDAFAQSLGAFTDLEDLKVKMRENLVQEKAQKAKDVRRGKIIDALLQKIDFSVPKIFVESELDKIIGQMKDDVSRYGLTFEGYLQQLSKTEEDMRKEFADQAEKRAKLQLVLNKIATDEKIESEKAAVDEEMKHALEHFPDARPDLLRIHIETVMRNEKVLQLLESSS